MSRHRNFTDDQFKKAVKDNLSIAKVLKELKLQPAGSNYKTVHFLVKKFSLDTSHWSGQGYLLGKNHTWGKERPLNTILIKDSDFMQSFKIKNKLIKNNILEAICSMCNLEHWLNNPIPLELDHINGVSNDNRIENLRLLCPNCHSLTPTYRGKNKNRKI